MAISTSDTAGTTRTLGFGLLQRLAVPGQNLCVSPLSVSCALQLALAGAGGRTAEEMIAAMGITSPNPVELAKDCANLLQVLQAPQKYGRFEGEGATLKLMIANSLWAHRTVQLSRNYCDALTSNYAAEARIVDFADPQTLRQMNGWVSQKTAGKIPTIINSLKPDDLLVLINCAYFKARWFMLFDKGETAPHDFHVSESLTMRVPMMIHNHVKLAYFQDRNMQMALLPYTDARFGMYIVLPAPDMDVNNLVAQLSGTFWDEAASQLQDHEGVFAMPRFRVEFDSELNDVLQSLGIREAFTKEANFRNMFTADGQVEPFFQIGRVIHKTFIDVDEQGTEAAAATAVMCWGAGLPPPVPPFEMIVDRPFLFVLRELTTGTTLFLGIVNTPEKVEAELESKSSKPDKASKSYSWSDANNSDEPGKPSKSSKWNKSRNLPDDQSTDDQHQNPIKKWLGGWWGQN
jgi:serine protease inhibitor